jgi:hypothetical protein
VNVDLTLEAATMLINIAIETTRPLTGSASSEGNGPVSFVGWMGLLRVVAELTEAMEAAADAGLDADGRPAIKAMGNGTRS